MNYRQLKTKTTKMKMFLFSCFQPTMNQQNSMGIYYGERLKLSTKNGKGKIMYPNGEVWYEGNLIDGLAQGTGKFLYEKGTVFYEGGFHKGDLHGKGVLYDEDGSILQEGKWNKGMFVDPNNKLTA